MPDAVHAAPAERLPWLPNAAPASKPKARRSPVAPAILAAAALAVSAGGWLIFERDAAPEAAAVEPAPTVALPPPVVAAPAPAEPQGPSAAERQALTPVAAPAAPKPAKKKARPSATRPEKARPAAVDAPAYEPRAWASGVRGRIIQLGAFRTSAQAQDEWKRVYYRYPLLRPLPPRVIKSKIRGRTHYRLQLGTFSQAHSELLCQRLRTLGEGCMVLGLRGRRG